MLTMLKQYLKTLPGLRRIVQQRDWLLLEPAGLTEKIRQLEYKKQARLLSKHQPYPFTNTGYCFCCDAAVEFAAQGEWWRDQYICRNCGSIPRDRALMASIERHYPESRSSSPENSLHNRAADRVIGMARTPYSSMNGLRIPLTLRAFLSRGITCTSEMA